MADPSSHETEQEFSELPEIWQPVAPALQEIFAAIPAAIGVPGVHLLWRLLANFPSVLEACWSPLAAALSSRALADGARELWQRSFIEEAVGLPSHKAFRGDLVRAEIDADFRDKISNFNDLSQYGLARLLILAAAINTPAPLEAPREAAPAPREEPPTGQVYVPPLREGEARGKAIEVLDRVRREHKLALLDDYYRSLARIPDYLAAAWNAIGPIVNDPVYVSRAASLAERAAMIAARLPAPIDFEAEAAGLAEPQATQLRGLLVYFSRVLLPQTLIDATLVKALTEGPERATRIPFDAAT